MQTVWNLKFFETDNELLLFYAKISDDLSNIYFNYFIKQDNLIFDKIFTFRLT